MAWNRKTSGNIDIKDLTLGQYRGLKNFEKMMEVIGEATSTLTGESGIENIFLFLHHMIAYLTVCILAKKFPALNRCWENLMPLYLKTAYEPKLLVYCWMFFDFPLEKDGDKVLADYYIEFLFSESNCSEKMKDKACQFLNTMKSSRLGLYQVVLCSKKSIKCKELFSGEVINLGKDREYKGGDILLTRIVNCSGETFMIHPPIIYSSEEKEMLESKIPEDLSLISDSGDKIEDYKKLMKLSSPHWMYFTYAVKNPLMIFPDEYLNYYQ